ncbi:probable methyltransferase PMT27 [Cucurbita pepo subsp. pepo]|uniref:probable methyltransferase PMT27 n=1 Tax=Cucurbita pepo subsp. pepo TaxID=3664 RepID=UPI000C9D9538|nr:probable methyltransferase PMT27 [Cucurbita pepo subsp. pepo]XP_023544459.1 probable methyltransferase PMT27 [Cucurbita pepo subsp. pepo]
MALGRPRGSKRSSSSSSSSYASTVTTLVFLSLCVLGVWMLPSNSVLPPPSTTRTSSDETQLPKSQEKDATSVFEDNPGDLPLDAIKSDDAVNIIVDDGSKDQESRDANEAQLLEETVMTRNQQPEDAQKTEDKLDSGGSQEQSNESTENVDAKSNEMPLQVDGQEQQKQIQEEPENNANSQEIQQAISNEEQLPATDVPENSGDTQNDQQKPESEPEKVPQEPEIHNQDDDKAQQETQQQQEQDNSNTSDNSKKPTEDQESQGTESKGSQEASKETKTEIKVEETTTAGSLESSVIPKESKESKKSWSTQAAQSENENDRRREESSSDGSIYGYTWKLCNVTAGADYIPCLDNEKAIKKLRTTKHFEHRERHCPEEGPTCLVSLPENYKTSIEWPQSRDKIWYHNVPRTKLAEVKGHQNWVKVTGEFLTFPGGGTQFIHGALHYIDFLQQSLPDIEWGKKTRVILDVGCGVASFGGYLFEKDVLAMSFAPKDEHEAQVQFALERGIPAISAVMGSQRLPFPSMVFDLIHCARCRVPWHEEGGMLLLELNRVLRPGGFFVWSATPVYQTLEEDVEIWKAMSVLTKSMCWELMTIQKDKLNSIGAAIYRKPTSNECYDQRNEKRPSMCKNDDDPNAAWYVPLQACMHRVPVDNAARGSNWPKQWPQRLQAPPYWLNSSQMGVYGKPAPQDFSTDYEHWKRVVNKTYMNGLGINLSNIRNVMDMRSVYGGFAAALRDLKVWVINVVNVDSPDTLPVIYERGLFGIYHDWCESFSTYPRTYDLLHADHLFSKLKKRCKLPPVLAEVDRIVRPGGKLIVRDESSTIGEVENMLKSLRWEVHLTFSKNQEGLLSAQKGNWRPDIYAESS